MLEKVFVSNIFLDYTAPLGSAVWIRCFWICLLYTEYIYFVNKNVKETVMEKAVGLNAQWIAFENAMTPRDIVQNVNLVGREVFAIHE